LVIKKAVFCLLAVAAVSSAAAASGAVERTSASITLRGNSSQNVRPFTLIADSNVSWRCSGCAGANFVFSTRQNIPVNSLGPTSGKSFLSKGRYTGVSVIGNGAWSITMSPAPKRPVRSSYVLSGTGGQNIAPFVLTHDSDVSWFCAGCKGSNFVLSTGQGIPVNALGPVKGKSFLERGRYTGISVIATGPWKIIIK
jgi:hypothetical protein